MYTIISILEFKYNLKKSNLISYSKLTNIIYYTYSYNNNNNNTCIYIITVYLIKLYSIYLYLIKYIK